MFYPRLKTRPRSTHTVYRFGGLNHNDEAPVGMTNGTTMRWYDERNLGHDKAPMLCTVQAGVGEANLDGNNIQDRIIGWCEGEHPVLLDELGNLWCNGHSLNFLELLDPVPAQYGTIFEASASADWGKLRVPNPYATSLFFDPAHRSTITIKRFDRGPAARWWYNKETGDAFFDDQNQALDLGDMGIVITDGSTPEDGDEVEISFVPYYSHRVHRMVRFGAFVIDATIRAYCNVEDLAAGRLMVQDDNFGYLDAQQLSSTGQGDITLTLCRIDGTPYTGAVASATEPVSHDHVWIDTSGTGGRVVREWSVSSGTWVVIPSTYVKISGIHVANQSNLENGAIRAGDGVQFSIYDDDGLDPDVKLLLTSAHVIIDAQNENLGTGYVIVPGVLPAATVTLDQTNLSDFSITRSAPQMDFIVEAQNRLWGCRYGPARFTTDPLVNEIYCCKLGDPTNWQVFEGLSTDSWVASRGTAAPFTGAAVLNGNPLFFREGSLEKVYPSNTGAHQIQTFTLDGVEAGSASSLVVIDERLYYKSRLGVCVYDGTMPRLISGAFGNMRYMNGVAARHRKQYVISMTPVDGGKRLTANYNTATGEWHLERNQIEGLAITWMDELIYIGSAGLPWRRYSGQESATVEWFAESGVIGYELPEHRFISCVRIRLRMIAGGSMTVKIRYQDDTAWQTKGTVTQAGPAPDTREFNIFPRRCDHFRLRLQGVGHCEILSMSFRMERSEGGH